MGVLHARRCRVPQVKMAGDCIGPEVKKMVDELQNGEVFVSKP